jgi:hypothetical protein
MTLSQTCVLIRYKDSFLFSPYQYTLSWLDPRVYVSGQVLDKVETHVHDSIRELVTWECKEHGVKS